MIHSLSGLITLLTAVTYGVTFASAGFSASSTSNIAVYWGQNSYGQATGSSLSQQRLSYYCQNTNVNIIPLAFLNVIVNPTTVNFANAGDRCSVFSGTTLLSCPEIEADIKTCQSTYGKTILLSIGGATYTEGGFSSSSAAVTAANNIWAMFGPVQSGSSVNRPFNTAVIDGFDFDFESATSNMAPFAQRLRTLMNAATAAGGKSYYLSAAPQCPYPDVADNDMLNGAVSFDFIMVQFYNNYCGLQSFVSGSTTQNNFNFGTWDTWARTVSLNKNVKVLLGIPGNSGAAGSGYVSGSSLAAIIAYCKSFSSFGGVMVWDMTQLYANSGFLAEIVSDLGQQVVATTRASTSTVKPTSTSKATTPTTMRTTSKTTTAKVTTAKTTPASTKTTAKASTTTTAKAASSTLVAQWGQCGGLFYTGSTTCQSPYVCVASSIWWSQCQAAAAGAQTTSSKKATSTKAATTVKATSTTSSKKATTTASSSNAVAQWGQCGGIGYTGSTVCKSPYKCVANSVWWAQCQ